MSLGIKMTTEKKIENIGCIKVIQPIGEFYIASMKHTDVISISYSDVRRIEDSESEFESYLGIQRNLSPKRVTDITKYVQTLDACFPTSVILAVPEECIEYDHQSNSLTIKEYISEDDDENSIPFEKIAKILDGQHRLAGLKNLEKGSVFNLNVSIFVGADVADQATIFSSVNLAQTKVNKSLSYDLYDLAKKRSPQKTCHNIVVALNSQPKSPFSKKIKRLGTSSSEGSQETIAQATFINQIIKLLSSDPISDRDLLYRGNKISTLENPLKSKTIFRNFFANERDLDIAKIIWNYFDAVKQKWPRDWDDSQSNGSILSRTNGFKALSRLLRDIYVHMNKVDQIPSKSDFFEYINKSTLPEGYFTTDNYKPGSSGESKLYKELFSQIIQS